VGNDAPWQFLKALFHGADRIAIKIGRSLFELGEVFDRAEAPLGAMDLLVKDSAETNRIQSESPFLRANVRAQVELSGRVPIDVAIEASDANGRLG